MRRLGGAALVAALMFTAGCGDGEADRAATAKASASASADRAYQECADATGPLMKALSAIDSRVSVGLNIQAYGEAVGAAKVEYDELEANTGLSAKCRDKVALKLSGAMGSHSGVLQVWNSCVQTSFCSMSSGEARELSQKAWRKAPRQVAAAKIELEKMKP